MSRLSRRQFVVDASSVALALLSACGRAPIQPQLEAQPSRTYRLGWLAPVDPEPRGTPFTDAFVDGLGERGYVEGKNLAIEYRSAEGRNERLPELAAELSRLPLDVIFAVSTPAAQAAKQATSTVPIVFSGTNDPVGTGLVASLAAPGGNITGLSNFSVQLSGKRLELLRETVRSISRIAVIWNPSNPSNALELREMEDAARLLGLHLLTLGVWASDDLDSVLQPAISGLADAIIVLGDPFLAAPAQASRISGFATSNHLPSMALFRQHVETGYLMAYGPNFRDSFRRAAYYVDRILKGAKPADLPVEQPMRFEFIVNMKTARELGITFPHEVALQITEVIE
jgi:putative ABC transport system substrate-binding protein